MRAEVKRLHSPDSPEDFGPAWQPDSTDFGVFVQAMIGPADRDGEESFDFTVCTPGWLAQQSREKGFAWGRGYLIVDEWRYETVERAVRDLVASSTANEWRELGERIGRYTHWEFEDYRD